MPQIKTIDAMIRMKRAGATVTRTPKGLVATFGARFASVGIAGGYVTARELDAALARLSAGRLSVAANILTSGQGLKP